MTGRPWAAFASSFLGGLLLVSSNLISSVLTAASWLAILALLTALVLLAAACLLWVRPRGHLAWGAVIVACSLGEAFWLPPVLFAFFLLGPIGAGLGVVGGVLGILWNPITARPR